MTKYIFKKHLCVTGILYFINVKMQSSQSQMR